MKPNRYASAEDVIDACYHHLESNLIEGERWGLKYRCYKPSQTKYGPFQWLWDSGWHMITWSHREPENAIQDLRSMLQFQQPNGFIPEMIFWGKKSFIERVMDKFCGYSKKTFGEYSGVLYTDITQMPMLTYSLRSIWNTTKDVELLKEFVPKLVHYLEWWRNERDPDNDGLVSIIHPWESGLDASPLYDPAHNIFEYPVNVNKYYSKFLKLLWKYQHTVKWNQKIILEKGWFNFEDVGLCSVYADGWGVLSKLAAEFDQSLSEKCRKYEKEYGQKIIDKCWDEKLNRFISYYHQNGQEKVSSIETIQSLFPLLLTDLPKEIADEVVENLRNPEKFGLPYPIPSTSKSEKAFNPLDSRLMWRGPSWGSTTWLVMEGLIKHGYMDEANSILDRWLEMYQKYGISEYHNPLTGEMEGQEGLGMATVIVDMLHRLQRV